ncbi:MAG TPA: hypothetical protein VJ810_05470 [Blastocatellia bacterium]|nr:hypothetical protein [Blastocatellia bacterium]
MNSESDSCEQALRQVVEALERVEQRARVNPELIEDRAFPGGDGIGPSRDEPAD